MRVSGLTSNSTVDSIVPTKHMALPATRKPESRALLTAILLAATLSSSAWAQAPATQTTIQRYCAACHSQKLKTAGVVLENAQPESAGADPVTWEKVLRKLRASEMPPASAAQPSEAERKALVSQVTLELDRAAAAHPNPGRPTIHRLNRTEYRNAIRDLFSVDVPADALPQDDSGYGFDNIADVLSMSPVLVERYIASAQKVARLALGDTRITPTVDDFDALAELRTSRGIRGGRNERVSEDLPFDSARGLSLRYTFAVDAEYEFSIKLSGGAGEFGETAPPIGEVLQLKVPVQAGIRHIGLTFMRSDAIPEGSGGRGGRGGANAPKYLDLRLDGALLKRYEVSLRVPEGKEINQLSIGGPYNITGPGDTPGRRRVLICRPPSPGDADSCAAKIIRSVGLFVYRRPLTDKDVTPLMNFYRSGSAKNGFEGGIESTIAAMLVSPDFLFRIETDPSGAQPGGIHEIGQFELASRLSFFLWSSIPDEELLTLAQEGKLSAPPVLQAQIQRMLDDPKSDAFVDNFTGQWLMLRNLEQIKPDPLAFPGYDYSLRQAFQEETRRFFSAILRENRPVTDLLSANFTFVNQRLAEFYGLPGVYGPRFRRVELADSRRAGLLGQGSILTVTSYPNRTSVVQRGKWILENLLASPPPPPPPDVPPLDLQEKGRKLTVRQAMEVHRANAVCASCHARMDPIGFALENYNGIGAWRDSDGGAAIDASGKFPDGTAFEGVEGLRQLLLTRNREQFLSAFTEKLTTYALGRGVETYDRPAIREILRRSADENYTISSLIRNIVFSNAFLMKRNRDI
jgi:mono/diheme cytochrome c family protein